jgi:hypothetical protein
LAAFHLVEIQAKREEPRRAELLPVTYKRLATGFKPNGRTMLNFLGENLIFYARFRAVLE